MVVSKVLHVVQLSEKFGKASDQSLRWYIFGIVLLFECQSLRADDVELHATLSP